MRQFPLRVAKKDDNPVKLSGVSLNKTALTLTVGGSETLTAAVAPENAENKAVMWKSNKAGIATVTVTTADGSKTATCAVTVNEPAITMTIAKSGEVEIELAGTGTATIDRGDGSAPQTVTLSAVDTEYNHSFSGTTSRTIAIDGQNITHQACHYMELTALDVGRNTALTYLQCNDNPLSSLDVSKNTELTEL